MQKSKEVYHISEDKTKLNIPLIHSYLTQSYWAKGIPIETVEKSIENSFCIGIYNTNEQIGFARLVTDYATFAYLADVFIVEEHRGKGLSKKLLTYVMGLDWVAQLRNIMLATHDAHEVYEPYGFKLLTHPKRYMYKFNLNVYEESK